MDAEEPRADDEDVFGLDAAEGALLGGVADLHPGDAREEGVGEVGEGLVVFSDHPPHDVVSVRDLLQALAHDKGRENSPDQLSYKLTHREFHLSGLDKKA